jgi:nucleoside-diphosphate-sugar epimerase
LTVSSTNGKTILLTGATGVVGTPLLPALADHEVICLVHNAPVAPNGGRVESVRGSVTEPMLGLDAQAYDELARRVDTVLNAAAITDYTEKREAMFAVNTTGVEHTLELARRADADYFNVSTAFATVPPVEVDDSKGSRDVKRWWNPVTYLDSKRAADELVANSVHRAATLRLPIVFGDSETGETENFQGLHVLIRAFFDGALPLVPLDTDRHIDFIPRDVIAKLIVHVIEAPFEAREWWLTAGDRGLTVDDLMRIGTAYLGRIGSDIPPPRVVPPDMVDRLIRPVFLPALPARLQRRFEQLMQLEPLFFTELVFESSLAEIERTTGPIDLKLETGYLAAVDYWRSQQSAKKLNRQVEVAT